MRSRLLAAALFGALFGACAETPEAPDAAPDAAADAAFAPDLAVADQAATGSDMRTSCDLVGGEVGERLFVTATTMDKVPYAAERRAGAWTPVPAGGSDVIGLIATDVGGRPLAIGRRSDDSLVGTTYEPCTQQLPAPSPLFTPGLSADRPGLAGGARVDLVFPSGLTDDHRLYASRFEGTWQTPTPLNNLLSTRSPAVVRVGSALHALFVASDGQLYDGLVDANGGVASPIPGATTDRSPAAVATADGTIYAVWKSASADLAYAVRDPSGAWSTGKLLCDGQPSCSMQSEQQPQLVLDRAGAPSLAWIGKGNGLVYTVSLDGTGLWSGAMAVSSEPTALPPAIAPGLPDAELELVYVRAADGKARHVRRISGVYGAPSDLPGGPVTSAPSLLRLGAP